MKLSSRRMTCRSEFCLRCSRKDFHTVNSSTPYISRPRGTVYGVPEKNTHPYKISVYVKKIEKFTRAHARKVC